MEKTTAKPKTNRMNCKVLGSEEKIKIINLLSPEISLNQKSKIRKTNNKNQFLFYSEQESNSLMRWNYSYLSEYAKTFLFLSILKRKENLENKLGNYPVFLF